MAVDKKQVELIVEQVLAKLSTAEPATSTGTYDGGAEGVFQEMDAAIQAAVVAHQQLVQLPLAVRAKIIQAIRDVGWTNREEYGRMELEETDLGAIALSCNASEASSTRCLISLSDTFRLRRP